MKITSLLNEYSTTVGMIEEVRMKAVLLRKNCRNYTIEEANKKLNDLTHDLNRYSSRLKILDGLICKNL